MSGSELWEEDIGDIVVLLREPGGEKQKGKVWVVLEDGGEIR